MLAEFIAGLRRVSSGAQSQGRSGPFSELIVNDTGLGRYFEACRYDTMFTSMIKAVTIAATHNSPIAAVTATPVLGLFNPAASKKALVFQRIACGTVSGTPAGGGFVLNAIPYVSTQTTAAVTGSIFSNSLKDAVSPQGSVCRVYNNVALTALAPVAANEISLVGQATAAAAAGNGGPGAVGEDIGGAIIVPPGVFVAIMAGTGAGTTWIVNASWSWVEVDWPL
jgi:hypothetical protein